MNRILTKYNITNLSADNPLSVTYALNERCKMIPESVSLAYFVKVLCTQDPIKASYIHNLFYSHNILSFRRSDFIVGAFCFDTPTERTIPIFHPSPFSDGKPNFYPLHIIGFHIKQTTPYLCPKPHNSIELLILHEVGLLLITEE
jgi:hypothetical protein